MNEESEGEGETNMFSFRSILSSLMTDYRELLLSLALTPGFAVYLAKNGYDRVRIALIILLCIAGVLLYLQWKHAPDPKRAYFLSVMFGDERSMRTGFTHKSGGGTWIFTGSAVINIDGQQHTFIGGGHGQRDALLKYNSMSGKFEDVIDRSNLSMISATFSAVSFDVNGDGLNDLIVGRKDGVYQYVQQRDTPYTFKMQRIMPAGDRVPLALSVSDYNRDGRPDIYVSYFTPMKKYRGTVFNNPEHGRKNTLLAGQKDGGYRDVTLEARAGGMPYNTFTGAFVDLNNDQWPDLVLSHDSGEVEILANQRGRFESKMPFRYKGNWMGLATGDYDNDGDTDLFLTNIGTDTKKDDLSVGDLRSDQHQTFAHVLLRNDGKFKFVEDNDAMGIRGDGFGWGAMMVDTNLDGNKELLFAENTKLFPKDYVFPKPGHYYQDGKRKFRYMNHNFGQTPLITDFNHDGVKDVVWINMDGPAIAYRTPRGNNNYVTVSLPETVEYANAMVVVKSGKRKFYQQVVQGGTGFGSDSSNNLQFGLGKLDRVDLVTVRTLTGKVYTVKNPKINSIIKLKQQFLPKGIHN